MLTPPLNLSTLTSGAVRLSTVTSARPKREDKTKVSFKHSLQATSAKINRLKQDKSLEDDGEEEEDGDGEEEGTGENGSEGDSDEGSGEEETDEDGEEEPKAAIQVCV